MIHSLCGSRFATLCPSTRRCKARDLGLTNIGFTAVRITSSTSRDSDSLSSSSGVTNLSSFVDNTCICQAKTAKCRQHRESLSNSFVVSGY
jgi:hypothetical protein